MSANELVDHPGHYQHGGRETIYSIQSLLTPEEYQGFCAGNVIKYLARYRHKGGSEDLRKARVYLNWLVEARESVERREKIEISLESKRTA